MKKFLLPMVALLMGGVATQAEEVTVKYYGYTYQADAYSDTEVLSPSTHELVDNGDGSYTLKRFLNAKNSQGIYCDITFSFDAEGALTMSSTTNIQKSNNIQALSKMSTYTANLQLTDGTDVTFPGQIYYPLSAYKCPVEKVTTLGENDPYKYRVVICSGVKDKNIVPALTPYYQFQAGVFAPFVCVFDMVKNENTAPEPTAPTAEVRYYKDENGLVGKEIFEPTNVEYTVNADKSVTLKNWFGGDFTFTQSGTKIQKPNIATSGQLMIDVIDPEVTTVSGQLWDDRTQTVKSFGFSDTFYSYKLWANAEKTFAAGEEYTLPLYVQEDYSSWELLGDTDEGTRYKVLVRTTYKIPVTDKDEWPYMDYFNVSGWMEFYYVVPNEIEESGNVEMIYKDQYGVELGSQKYNVTETSFNNFTVSNFLGSKAEVALVATDVQNVEGKDYYAEGNIRLAEAFRGTEGALGNAAYNYVKLPDNQTFDANVPGGINYSKPLLFYNPAGGSYVRYYKEGDKVKMHFCIKFGLPSVGYSVVEWDWIAENESGIADVVVDENAPVEWFNLQGVRVNGENLTPGIYIKRQGSKTVKVLVK